MRVPLDSRFPNYSLRSKLATRRHHGYALPRTCATAHKLQQNYERKVDGHCRPKSGKR